MDYFKHYVSASDGNTLTQLEDKFGHAGYSYWMKLMELCVQNWDGKTEPTFNFYETIVRRKLKISSIKLKQFFTFCEGISDVSVEYNKKNIQISIPNLKTIKESRGRIYGNKVLKTDIYRIDKEEDKEIDTDTDGVGNSQVSSPNFTKSKIAVDSIIQLFNDTIGNGKAGKISFCRGLGRNATEDLLITMGFAEFSEMNHWKELFETVAKSPFLTGQVRNKSWVATLDWICKRDNALNILSGKYQPQDTTDSESVDDHINSVEL